MLPEISNTLQKILGTDYLYFNTALKVGTGPVTVNLWAACTSPDGRVYVMDADEQWHEVEEGNPIIPQLKERIDRIANAYYRKEVVL